MRKNPLGDLIEDAADVVDKAPPRPSGWWVIPASYITTALIFGGAYLVFGFWGVLAVIAAVIFMQIGHKIGTGRWITWDQ